jgi:hypothetical protein
VHKRIISAVKGVESISVRVPYIILRGHWCHIIVLNVCAPTEDKTDDVKDSLYGELECVFHKFPKYHMKLMLGDFSAKVGREDIIKPTIGNEISNDNGVTESKVRCSHIATSLMYSDISRWENQQKD